MARGGAAKEAANDIGRTELKTVVDNRPVGEILAEARIARDMDYAGVASQLRIRRTYIEAIEDGRLGDLPGSTYAIGFVRTYAELLDLDVPKIVAKFKREAAEFEDRTQLVFPEPMPGSRGPTASVILIAILMLAGAYGGWLYVSNKDRDTIELVPPLPESLSRLLSQTSDGGTTDSGTATSGTQSAETATEQVATSPEPLATVQQSAIQAAEVSETVTENAPTAAAASEEAVEPTIVNETIASVTTTAEAVQETAAETAGATSAEPVAAEGSASESAAPVLSETQTAATQQTEAAAAPVTEQVQETVAAATTATEVEAPAEQAAAPAASEPAQQQAATEETELPTVGASQPSSFGSSGDAARIVIRATSPSWVEITAADGKVLLNRLLRTGDTFRVPDQPGIKLVTGSAGGLEFTVDGTVAPKIGEIGDVRRDVLLEPDALLKAQ